MRNSRVLGDGEIVGVALFGFQSGEPDIMFVVEFGQPLQVLPVSLALMKLRRKLLKMLFVLFFCGQPRKMGSCLAAQLFVLGLAGSLCVLAVLQMQLVQAGKVLLLAASAFSCREFRFGMMVLGRVSIGDVTYG